MDTTTRKAIRVKARFPFTANEESRMLSAKVDAAIYMLQRTRKENIYQKRLDELFPNHINAIALWLAGLSVERVGLYLNIAYKDVKSIIRLYNLSNEAGSQWK